VSLQHGSHHDGDSKPRPEAWLIEATKKRGIRGRAAGRLQLDAAAPRRLATVGGVERARDGFLLDDEGNWVAVLERGGSRRAIERGVIGWPLGKERRW
jgi:hypothetical protein